jgi:hypothetical protein
MWIITRVYVRTQEVPGAGGTPVIQEAEIRRIAVQSQPEQIVHETLSQKTFQKKAGVVQGIGLEFKPQYSKSKRKKPYKIIMIFTGNFKRS